MTFTVTAVAAACRIWPRVQCDTTSEAQAKMSEWTRLFKQGDFSFPAPCAPGWKPEQLCITVTDMDNAIVDYRNVKR